MFPWVYGFEWNAANVIFLGIFFGVVIVILSTLTVAVLRSRKTLQARATHAIRWETDFEDLPEVARVCRHEMDGHFQHRTCQHGFECGECETHRGIVAGDSGTPAGTRGWEADGTSRIGSGGRPQRYYHRGHTWVQPEADGTMTIGLDDFGTRLIGPGPDAVLPKVGYRLHVNGRAWKFTKGGATVRVRSPIAGEVVAVGGRAQGWYLKMQPTNGVADLRPLLRGTEMRPWLGREMERLQQVLGPQGVGVRLTDGGELVDDVTKFCKGAHWDVVCGEMLLEP
jgi:glycine cleavage system H protein